MIRTFCLLILSFAALLIDAPSAVAVGTPAPFENMDQVAEDLGQEFYRAWRLRISELAQNYQQIPTAGGVQFRAKNLTGCTVTNSSSLLQPVAEIYFATVNNPGPSPNLEERITYRGCNGQILLAEVIRTKGTGLTPMSLDDVLNGTRRFIRKVTETERVFTILDPVRGPVVTIGSQEVRGSSVVSYAVLQKPVITIRSQTSPSGVKTSRIDLEDFNIHWRVEKSSINSSTRGLKSNLTVIQRGPTLFYRLGESMEFTSQREFEQSYSDDVVWAIDSTASSLLNLYLAQLPTTEAPKPSIGANQRVLDELNQALLRVTSKVELERVRLLIQEYIIGIQQGTILIDDRRPK